ncbi:GNAT family N-acetyltransferase [Paludicola sp. MB14-C6]|uniref:GNAT family N-acetyltransferase n=1 Tax=Paludihabitans sp. MB14-C6 TaxID=3070656 RepID=UPI0027DB7A8E|nr:GNAT family N-acetyltransferase [Paludicola sp. MB14-C6]WMJ22827.1 GNAT family N-acetyltransferase [Paludicola sp. MB14-C6]
MDITYANSLTAQEYNVLRKSVGWSEIHLEKAKLGLEHSAFITVAQQGSTPIGMARVISDYGYVAYIADVVVNPSFQGHGIGKQLMQNVIDYINSTLIEGHFVMVNLMAASGKESFYEGFGFQKRPTNENGSGMTLWIRQQ